MKHIFTVILIVFLTFGVIGCTGNKISNTSNEFSQDVFKLLKEVDKDIKNKTNETSIVVPGSLGHEFINKYEDKELSNNEREIVEIIKSALGWRTGNFIVTDNKQLDESEYMDSLDEECIKELEKIKDIK